MSGDYLWDGSGEPDPEIQHLEAVLRPLRGTQPAPELGRGRPRPAFPPGGWRTLAAAAAVVLALAALFTRARPAEPQDRHSRRHPAQTGPADRGRMGHHAKASAICLRDAQYDRIPA